MKDLILNLLQWPAMTATLISAWLVTSQSKQKRNLGFWCFIISNMLWIFWGWHDGAYGLIAMQIGHLFINLLGAQKNESQEGS